MLCFSGVLAFCRTSRLPSSQWGLIGLVKSLALEVGEHGVTVDAVPPGGVATPMPEDEATYKAIQPDLDAPGREDVVEFFDKGAGLMDPD